MRQPRRRSNPLKLILLAGVVAFLIYINQTIEPLSPSLFLPSPTPTTSPEEFITEAEDLVRQGKYSLALQAYDNAIRTDPQNPAFYIAAARLYIYSGQYEKAIENASNAVLLNQDSSMGESLRGLAHGFSGNYLDAEGSLNRAIELDPGNAAAYAYFSIVLSNKVLLGQETLGDLDRAIEASRNAQSIAPDALETHWARGIILEVTGNSEEAISELEQAITQNSNIAELHIALGRNYRSLGRNDLAVESFTRANALNPSDPNPDLYISRTYFNIGEYAKSILYAEQAVADNPTDSALYGNLGVAYRKNYELDKALLTLKLAVRGGTTPEGVGVEGIPISYSGRTAEFYYNYGLTLMDLGYCNEAVDIAQMLLQTVPNDEIATYNSEAVIIEQCYQKINDLQMLKLPTPTMLPTWTPRPTSTPTMEPTVIPSPTVMP